MFGNQDREYFNSLWRQKLAERELPHRYVPGENPRVDAALQVVRNGERLLDIGCGSGLLLMALKERFQGLYGVDIAEAAVLAARAGDVQADVVNLNTESLPYPDSFFDATTILSTLQYFYNMDRVLQDCWRVLAPHGLLYLSVPNIRALWRIRKLLISGSFSGVSKDDGSYDGGTLHYFATANVRDLLSRNRFRITTMKGIFCRPALITRLTDRGLAGAIKREFFSAEVFITAMKI